MSYLHLIVIHIHFKILHYILLAVYNLSNSLVSINKRQVICQYSLKSLQIGESLKVRVFIALLPYLKILSSEYRHAIIITVLFFIKFPSGDRFRIQMFVTQNATFSFLDDQ